MGKKVLALVFVLTLTGMIGLFAIDINLYLPELDITIDTSNPFIAAQIESMGLQDPQSLIRNNFNKNDLWSMVGDVDSDLQDLIVAVRNFDPKPTKLIGAFADSSVFASTGASLRGYQGYSAFALSVGAVAGFQLPVNIFSLARNYDDAENILNKLFDEIEKDGDMRTGINLQMINAQLGINTGFLLKGLYVGVKGGWMNIDPSLLPIQLPMTFQTWSIGPMINYQLIPQFRLLGGIFLWRGLNVGTGFIYQRTSLNLDFSLTSLPGFDDIINGSDIGFTVKDNDIRFPIYEDNIFGEISDPRFRFGFNVITYTVPLEAVTSFRFLGFLNVSLGAGADLGFGNASLAGDLKGGVNIYGYEALGSDVRVTPGSISVEMGGENSANLFNPKAMGSLGLSVGPAIILDIPVTYYFMSNGFNFGINLGIAL